MTEASSRAMPDADGFHRLEWAGGRAAIAKRRRDMPPAFFAAEALGLDALRRSKGLRVPEVFSVGVDHIVLEDLGVGTPGSAFHANAAIGLARQHACLGEAFGFEADGWCGDSPQDNARDRDGHRFFAQRRLLPQAKRAFDAGRLSGRDMVRVDSICRRLDALIPPQPPVLLHGDLWQGNLHACSDGDPALIDAGAVHYGWAEAELAMLHLFGTPPEAFFAAYAEAARLDPGWRRRAPIYNLYHLLNHLNLFGAAYLEETRRVIERHG
ncbi:fructosamine kinase family protein [Luteimonas vadosa]|uniref:Fructosamine kinase family protein n=1 Tax=Luteimonas vadosa TaxID=1165507 RepID=A0ABP9E079_9GAMM